MTVVLPLSDLRTSPAACLFEGGRRAGVEISMYVTTFGPGEGPSPHLHPYPEVFLVEEGEATFTVAGDPLVVGAGHVVVVPAHTAHGFRNSGGGTLRLVSIHPSGTVLQTRVEG